MSCARIARVRSRGKTCGLLLLICGLAGAVQAEGTAASEEPARKHGHPDVTRGPGRIFPLYGSRLSSMGHDLPLPLGASYVGFSMERSFVVTDLAVAFGDGTPITIESVTVLPDSDASSNTFRADIWLLPLLNLYGFYGRTSSETVTFVSIEDPTPGPMDRPPITFEVPTSLDGDTWGLGVLLAAGYRGWFGTVNLNYSSTDLGLDSEITANVNSVRVGYHWDIGRVSAALWVGYAYWNVSKVVAGTIPVEGLGDLSFAVKYEPIEPSNMLLGGRLTLFDRVDLVLDWGVWKDVTTVTGQVSMRF